MSAERRFLIGIREDVDALEGSGRAEVQQYARQIRQVLAAGGAAAEIALTWVYAEVAAADDELLGETE